MGKSPQASTQSTTGSSDSNEPLSEEYEVSELPVLIHEVRSPYPPAARARKIQGAVILDLVVRSSGEVGSVKVVQSPAPELSEAAMKAVREFKFRPARLKDKPVAIQIRYTYRFILE